MLGGFSSPRYAAGTLAAGSPTSATTSPARSSPSTCGRTRDRPGRGGGGRATHHDLAGRRARRHVARLAGAAARARGCDAAHAARGSCARSPPRSRPRRRLHAGRRMSGSARASTGDSPCTTPGRCDRLRVLPADDPPQHVTFDDGARRVYVASGESGTLRTYRLADGKLLRTSRVTRGSYNVCALGGRVVTPSLDDGRLTLLDSRGLRSAHLAPHAHDAASWPAPRCRCWPASRPSRRGAP